MDSHPSFAPSSTVVDKVPGMLDANLLRSPHAHARLVAIDVSRARALPGVVAVVTGPDLAARDDIPRHLSPAEGSYRLVRAPGRQRGRQWARRPGRQGAAREPSGGAQRATLAGVEGSSRPAVRRE